MKNPPAFDSMLDNRSYLIMRSIFIKTIHLINIKKTKSDDFNYFSSSILNKKIRFLETDYVEKEIITVFLKTSGFCPQ